MAAHTALSPRGSPTLPTPRRLSSRRRRRQGRRSTAPPVPPLRTHAVDGPTLTVEQDPDPEVDTQPCPHVGARCEGPRRPPGKVSRASFRVEIPELDAVLPVVPVGVARDGQMASRTTRARRAGTGSARAPRTTAGPASSPPTWTHATRLGRSRGWAGWVEGTGSS